jgi:tellurite methyltransferase
MADPSSAAEHSPPPGPLSAPPCTAPPLKKAQEYAEVKDWKGYFSAVLGKPPRDTLLDALAAFEGGPPVPGGSHFAIDLGCGEGRDTLELLRRGWHVLAIDLMPEAFNHLIPRIPPEHRPRLQTQVATFESLTLQPSSCDLLNASFSLPFCTPAPPEAFPRLWQQITSAIKPRGRFAGQLFGDRDDWARRGDRIHHTRAQVDALFKDFTFEHLREEEKEEADGKGGKHWHVYHIVARKR